MRIQLLRYITKVSTITLGTRHPISVISFHLLDETVSNDTAIPLLELMIDLEEKYGDPAHDISGYLKRKMTRVLLRQGSYAAAEVIRTTCTLLRHQPYELG